MFNLLLKTETPEVLLGILAWVAIILGIILIVKFFKISKDVRKIKETLENIADNLNKKK